MLCLFIGLVVLWLLYRWYTAVYNYWEKRGIYSIPATFPFGSSADHALARTYLGHTIDKMYKEAAPHPYFGFFNMRSPYLCIRDPEIIRLVMAKEFSHFRDRQGFKVPKEDILGNHLFNLDGERWRGLRVKLSPTFTSGKLKGMFQHFITCSQGLEELILEKSSSPVDVKDAIARFTIDIICSCAFGLEANSIKDSESQFRKIALDLSSGPASQKYFLTLVRAFPIVAEFRPPRFVEKFSEDFMFNLVKETVEYREKTKLVRQDFLDLLMELREQGKVVDDMEPGDNEKPVQSIEMTMELMTAQCFVFFFAGYDTSSTVQTFCLYELALHPEIQERLYKEIDETLAKHGGLTYQAIQDMTYLDMVVSETIRKYPTLMYLNRCCTKDFVTPAGHKIKKGERIIIPLWSLHHDPEYFPNPETFDPERFSSEKKESIRPFTYLPFGEGPRICIGMRFGLLQTKVGLITVLRKYRLEPSSKTQIPLELSCKNFIFTGTNGPITLNLFHRKTHNGQPSHL